MKNLLYLIFAFVAAQGLAQTIPAVEKATPEFWKTGVDPALKTISLTFDQAMRYGFSSWLGPSGILPTSQLQSTSSPDGRTSTLSVRLQPGKVYVFSLNETQKSGVGFQNKKGVPLPRTFFVFQTTGVPALDDAPPRALTTIPGNAEQNVDPARIKSVSITFDRAMQATKHGLHMRENQKEIDLSKAQFQYSADGKTFTLAYDFKPGCEYAFEMNNSHDIGFASAKRIPLWPVKFAFSTQ